jgi:kumamolisin
VGNNGGFSAGPGWDACTGLGSPIASKLIPLLALAGAGKAAAKKAAKAVKKAAKKAAKAKPVAKKAAKKKRAAKKAAKKAEEVGIAAPAQSAFPQGLKPR